MDQKTPIPNSGTQGSWKPAAELLPQVYDELRRLAAHRIAREAPGQTLQATALVHEAYLRLVGDNDPGWHGRGHFFAAAAEAMRRILVEQARRRGSLKRGGDRRRMELVDASATLQSPAEEVLAVDEALSRLAAEDPIAAELAKLRYFAGLNTDEAANALGISRATAARHWTYARAWIRCEVLGDEGQEIDRRS